MVISALRKKEIIDDHYKVRLDYYEKRKQAQIKLLEKNKMIAGNKAKFISDILNENIDLRNKKMDDIITILDALQYDQLETDTVPYKYLTSMPMASLTSENIAVMIANLEKMIAELKTLKSTTVETIWANELSEFEQEYRRSFRSPTKASKTSKKLKVTTKK